jgi:hypothetical protein
MMVLQLAAASCSYVHYTKKGKSGDGGGKHNCTQAAVHFGWQP